MAPNASGSPLTPTTMMEMIFQENDGTVED
jgi:hypothetical protein